MQTIQYEIILYVSDQEKSKDFYASILNRTPSLDVPGMTEFTLSENLKLGLMPETSIAKILLDKTPHPNTGTGIPRCELYILLDNPEHAFEMAINNGAKEISPMRDRDWGDCTGYVSDADGHIIAFAKKL